MISGQEHLRPSLTPRITTEGGSCLRKSQTQLEMQTRAAFEWSRFRFLAHAGAWHHNLACLIGRSIEIGRTNRRAVTAVLYNRSGVRGPRRMVRTLCLLRALANADRIKANLRLLNH